MKKYYLLQKGEGVYPPTPEKALVPSGQTDVEMSSVKQEFELLAKRQKVLQVIDNYVAIIEGEEWDYVEDEVFLLKERLDFLRATAESAKDIDTLNEVHELVLEEIKRLEKLGEEQAEAEERSREREKQRKLSYIEDHYLNRGGSRRDVQSLVDELAKYGGIEGALQLLRDQEAMEDLRVQCFDSRIGSRFVEDVLFFSIPKVPTIAYVRQLWRDAQRICHEFGSQEFAWFWGWWGRFTVQSRQSLWIAFVTQKGLAQPAWAGYQLLRR